MKRHSMALALLVGGFVLLTSLGMPRTPLEAAGNSDSTDPRPNIIVVITDDQDGYSVPVMRNVMANPYGNWLWFTHGYAVDSIGGVARVSLLTGQYTHDHGIVGNKEAGRLDGKNTLPVWLNESGYYTGLIGKYLNGYPWDRGKGYVPPGWDYFQYYGNKNVDLYSDTTDAFLTDAIDSQEKPFFLLLSHRAPQRPARPPARYKDADVSIVPEPADSPNFAEEDTLDKPAWVRQQPLPKPGGYPDRMINGYPGYMWDSNWIRAERQRALRQVLAIDDGIQRMMDLLAAKGEIDNTVIFYLSDSGYSWGNHNKTGRACPYEECNLLPYLVFYPGTPSGGGAQPQIVDRLVTNLDMVSTIISLTGVTPQRSPQAGRNLLPLLEASDPATVTWDDAILLENRRGPLYYGIRTPEWKYVQNDDGFLELYDMVNDPFELENVAGRAEYTAIRLDLAQQLGQLVSLPSTPPPPPPPPPPPTLPEALILTSSSSGGTVSNVTFADEDILAFDTVTGVWSLLFDGSAVGLAAADIDAFYQASDVSLLLSLDRPLTIADLGRVDDSDILQFIPNTAGDFSAGRFEMYLDGSAVELTTNSEDIDALSLLPDGRLLISLSGDGARLTIAGAAAQPRDEDILAYNGQTGSVTAGSWDWYFDGSSIGLSTSAEDIGGLSGSEDETAIYFSTAGSFRLTNGLSGRRSDIAVCYPISNAGASNCDGGAELFIRSDDIGFSKEQMDALQVITP